MGPIIYFIEDRPPPMEVFHFAGALMDQFLEGNAPLRLW